MINDAVLITVFLLSFGTFVSLFFQRKSAGSPELSTTLFFAGLSSICLAILGVLSWNIFFILFGLLQLNLVLLSVYKHEILRNRFVFWYIQFCLFSTSILIGLWLRANNPPSSQILILSIEKDFRGHVYIEIENKQCSRPKLGDEGYVLEINSFGKACTDFSRDEITLISKAFEKETGQIFPHWNSQGYRETQVGVSPHSTVSGGNTFPNGYESFKIEWGTCIGTFNSCREFDNKAFEPENFILECLHWPKPTKENSQPELSHNSNCMGVKGDYLVFLPEILNNSQYNKNGHATFITTWGVYLANKNGKYIQTQMVDNGADYFKEGLVRAIGEKSKYGFVDKNLDIVIKPKYDFAFPFNNGVSTVCNDCREEKDPNSDYKIIVGGFWGAINKKGEVVVPIKYTKDELENSPEYKAYKTNNPPK